MLASNQGRIPQIQRRQTTDRRTVTDIRAVPQACGPYSNSSLFLWQCRVLFNGESTQTYFVNVCGYWPGLVTGLEVVGSIISTKREKERKEKHFVCYLQRRQTLMRQSTVMQHRHRWSFIWRLPWPWKPLNKV